MGVVIPRGFVELNDSSEALSVVIFKLFKPFRFKAFPF